MKNIIFLSIISISCLSLRGMEQQKQIIPTNTHYHHSSENHEENAPSSLRQLLTRANNCCDTLSDTRSTCITTMDNDCNCISKTITMTVLTAWRILACGIDFACLIPACVGRPFKDPNDKYRNDAFCYCSRSTLVCEARRDICYESYCNDIFSGCTQPLLKNTPSSQTSALLKNQNSSVLCGDVDITVEPCISGDLSKDRCCCYPLCCTLAPQSTDNV